MPWIKRRAGDTDNFPWFYLDAGCSAEADRRKAWKLDAEAAKEFVEILKKNWPGLRFEIEYEEPPLFQENTYTSS